MFIDIISSKLTILDFYPWYLNFNHSDYTRLNFNLYIEIAYIRIFKKVIFLIIYNEKV